MEDIIKTDDNDILIYKLYCAAASRNTVAHACLFSIIHEPESKIELCVVHMN
jgi:hypothetical protein